VAIPRKDLECNGVVVAPGTQLPHVARYIKVAHAERQMKIGVAPAVIMQVNMREPVDETLDEFTRGILRHRQITVANIKVQSTPVIASRIGASCTAELNRPGTFSIITPTPTERVISATSRRESIFRCTMVRSSTKGACPHRQRIRVMADNPKATLANQC